jgi:hypothetical protein
MTDGERIDLPSGDSLWYYDEDHSYWRHNPKTGERGRRLTGVTTVVKTLDHDPSNLLRWAAKTQCIGVAELYELTVAADGPDALHWLSTQDAIWRELTDHELTFEHVRDRAAKRGTNVHEIAFQALGMGRPVPDLDLLTEEEQGHAKAIMAFWLDHEPDPDCVEQIVYSERLGVAGRLDLLGSINGFDGPCVIDAKTGKYLSAGAHAQVGGGYPLLAVESGLVDQLIDTEVGAAERLIAHLHDATSRITSLLLQTREDGTYELIPAEGTPEQFEAAVAAYRAAGVINGAAARSRKARQTEREMERQINEAVAAA